MHLVKVPRMRGFETRSKEPLKLSFRQLIQNGIQDRSNAFNRFDEVEQLQPRFKFCCDIAIEAKQILEASYRCYHQNGTIEDSTFHLLTNDGTVLKCSSIGNSVTELHFAELKPSGGWFVGDLPIPLPESCGIQGSAIVCTEDAAVGLRGLTALLMKGVENDA